MNNELMFLAFVVVLGFLQLMLATVSSTAARGLQWNLSSREQVPQPLTGRAGRMDRAFQNFKETFPFYLAAVVVIIGSGRSGQLSYYGALLYLVARVIYVPIYVFDITVVRTIVWVASVLGIAAILAQLLV